ncbi:site-2 protease family protein [Criblamydia sequanensis]|uniref:Metallopeptidase, M50 family n=1 Tax=Candidatus Criblamydia sequanensis CRIB-18 TaxID=1437425 RepID=A0A090CZ46_9BACT|nr:site-2 protease family protein [Criblamydia sequanensis]CDR34162.1 Metallopeptidase, M50 family [Criblamydia sequanensis CRIB-18]
MPGIPIRIQPLFILMSAIIGWLSSQRLELTLLWMIVIFVSVLVHELGHALSAKYFGQHVMITLTGWGGVTRRTGKPISRVRDFIVVLLGPIFGLMLGLFAYFLMEKINPSGMLLYTLKITYLANLFWTVVNLIPVQPLDGGRLLAIILESLFGFKGVRFTYFLSIILCLIAGLYFFYRQNMLGGILFFLLLFENFRNFTTSLNMSDEDQNAALWKELRQGENLLNSRHYEEASSTLKNVIKKSGSGLIYMTAMEFLAETLKRQGKINEAYDLLLPVKDRLNTHSLKQFQEIAFLTKHFQEAVEIGKKTYSEDPNFKTALLNSLSFGELKKGNEALSWLKSALTYDISLENLMKESSFQTLLDLPEIQDFLSKKRAP